MKVGTIVITSFIISSAAILIGAFFKITHAEGAAAWLTGGLLASLVFVAVSIYEVRTSKRIDPSEKRLWTAGFVFMCSITGLLYILIGRKRVANNY